MGLFDGTALEQPVTCVVCGDAVGDCMCPKNAEGIVCRPMDQDARVRREKRRGKWVTVVYQLDPVATDLKTLAKRFKTLCSAGGSVTDDGIEIQGDHRDQLVDELRVMGYPGKPSGG